MNAKPEFSRQQHWRIIAGVLVAIFLWGGNNTGTRYLVKSWPPLSVGSMRFLCAGFLMVGLCRWTNLFGRASAVISPDVKRRLWWHGGFSLALYIAIFNLAMHFATASHVALYLAISPVWALLWEGRTGEGRPVDSLKRWGAAALALAGVVTLFWPALSSSSGTFFGEVLALIASVIWTVFGRACRKLGETLSGAEVSAHTMWRAGVFLLLPALVENTRHPLHWDPKLALVQLYCIIAGSIIAFALWNHALKHWKTSEVFLLGNLIPASTMTWAHFTLGEPVSHTFWIAMVLIVSGVIIGQTQWEKWLGSGWFPAE